MDIRNFFKKPRLEENIRPESNEIPSSSDSLSPRPSGSSTVGSIDVSSAVVSVPINKFDIGRYIGPAGTISISAEEKIEIFENTWVPENDYNFQKIGNRSFRREWLHTFAPWLAYSQVVNGALCKFCVLFKPNVNRGLQGAFILKGFTNFKKFTESARDHVQSGWHKNAVSDGTNLMALKRNEKKSIVNAISQSRLNLIEENRKKLGSIIRTIVFCGTHDLPLRGKESNEGVFKDLLKFRVEAGDLVLKDHIEKAAKNARYTSVRTEHELIAICENILANDVVAKANRSGSFSILADETSDIAGVEQLTFGIRFALYEDEKLSIFEEFLGFVELRKFDAQSIADAILSKCESLNLNMAFLVGQGYDGCSVMAGNENGVKTIIQKSYPNAHFVHCSSHRLNLVVNDLNKLNDIRNTIGTIKDIINFFRESNVRRQLLPSIPMLCETRWTEKHKTIRLFKKHFAEIMEKLSEIANGATNGKQKANCFYSAAIRPAFLISVFIMAKYSEILEPISAMLQSKQINLIECQNHIKTLIALLNDEREKFDRIFTECQDFCNNIGVEISIPRIAGRQTKRANYETRDPKEYYKLSIFLPYIDSLISSLNVRFSEENTTIFNLFRLYPSTFGTMSDEEINKLLLDIDGSGELLNEGLVWHKIVQNEDIVTQNDMLSAAKFVPKIKHLLLKSLSLPVTTASMERSFSTLRRVKLWLRSTMCEARLSGLCMLSVHREKIKDDEENFISRVINKFGEKERRLVFLFEN